MKASLAVLQVFLLTVLIGPLPDTALANSQEGPAITQTKEFFGTPISATYGYHDFADQASESYLPFQAFFNDSMGRIAKICGGSERDTVFIIEKENAVISAMLFGLIAAGSQQILLLQYQCVDLSLSSGRYFASFAVIKNIFVSVSTNQEMGQ
ncbi:hypothetical protein [Endozoicomonas sp.]|uniref:hypothetical protein n=1 Tax=Endozoicomonas sp. TaxID=1892382 RepID=UPI002888CA15|nr:hypothetical protein [Endozoicomonas sp.]